MLQFHDINIEDKPRIDELICASGCHGADYSFANLFIWKDTWHPDMCEVGGRIIISTPGLNVYSYPKGGGDQTESVDALIQHAHDRGQRLVIRGLTDRTMEEFMPVYGDRFTIEEDRDNADYMYTTEKLRYLKGRKLSSKRNHIKHFEKSGEWELRVLGCGCNCDCDLAGLTDSSGKSFSLASFEDARAFVRAFYEAKEDAEGAASLDATGATGSSGSDLADEAVAIESMFEHFCEIGFTGAMLYQNGEAVAFTAGTRLGETVFDVHFEKALPGVEGAYTMINREFVNLIAQLYPEIEMFNREEDMGIPGLRKAKESYHPDLLLMKYIAIEK